MWLQQKLQLACSIIMLLIGLCNQICRWTPAVVAWLAEIMRKPSRSDMCQRSVMDCFAHWLDLGCLHEDDILMEMVAELTEAAFWLLPSTNDGKTWVLPDLHKCLLGIHEGPCIAGELLTQGRKCRLSRLSHKHPLPPCHGHPRCYPSGHATWHVCFACYCCQGKLQLLSCLPNTIPAGKC